VGFNPISLISSINIVSNILKKNPTFVQFAKDIGCDIELDDSFDFIYYYSIFSYKLNIESCKEIVDLMKKKELKESFRNDLYSNNIDINNGETFSELNLDLPTDFVIEKNKTKRQFIIEQITLFRECFNDITNLARTPDSLKNFQTLQEIKKQNDNNLNFSRIISDNLLSQSKENFKKSFEYQSEEYMKRKIKEFEKNFLNYFKISDDLIEKLKQNNFSNEIIEKFESEKNKIFHLENDLEKWLRDNKIELEENAKKFLFNESLEIFDFDKSRYIDLKCTVIKNLEEDIKNKDSETISINDFLPTWLNSSDKKFLLVLGEYGIGKTTVCQYLAYELSQIIINSKTSRIGEIKNPKIPFIFPLTNAGEKIDLKKFITASIREDCCLKTDMTYKEFIENFRDGQFLVLFDAYDEMVQHIYADDIISNFEMFKNDLINSSLHGKFILTCREEFFRNNQMIKEMLENIDEGIFDVIKIPLFNKNQVNKFVANYKKITFESLKSINEMVTTRPVLLNILVKYLDKITNEKSFTGYENIKASDLYKKCIDDEIERKKEITTLKISKKKRIELLKILAKQLYVDDKSNIEVQYLTNKLNLKKFFNIDSELEIEKYLTEFLAFSFLVKGESNNVYKFSHKSFFEYLVSTVIVDEINQNKPDLINNVFTTYEINQFIAEQDINKENLADFIINSDKKTKQASNAISILNISEKGKLSNYLDLSKLSYINLERANLRGANLMEANLRGANLMEANLMEVNLERANLMGANLQGVILFRAILFRANLVEAILFRANLVEAILFRANLFRANLVEANLIYANLRGANLRGVNLVEANLMGANLYGANLVRANLMGANLYGANLKLVKNFNNIISFKDSKYCLDSTDERFLTRFPDDFNPKEHGMIEYQYTEKEGFKTIT